MDTHTNGVMSDLDPGSFMPMAPARATPAPANSRLETQLKKVTTCLRQCCSPSVNLALTRSTPSSRIKRPILVTSPRSPYLADSGPLSAPLCLVTRKEFKRRTHQYQRALRKRLQGHVKRACYPETCREHPLEVDMGTRDRSRSPLVHVHGHGQPGPIEETGLSADVVIYVGDGTRGSEAKVGEDAEHMSQLPPKVVGSIHGCDGSAVG